MQPIEKANFFIARFLMFILAIFMVLITMRLGTRYILINRLGMDNSITRIIMWDDRLLSKQDQTAADAIVTTDWQERYPFSLPSGQVTRWAEHFKWIDRWQNRIKYYSAKLTSTVELYANQHLMFRQPIVENANRYNRLIGWNLAGYSEYNNVVKLNDDYLTTFTAWMDVSDNINAVADFRNYLNDINIPLLFIQLPNKISRTGEEFSEIMDHYNENADRLVSGIRANGGNVLDLRDNVEQQQLNHQTLFFNSDHHWLPQTALWAAGEISTVLNQNFGYQIDTTLFQPDKYTYTVYEDWFLGSMGKKVTLSQSKPDDLSVIHPNFPVELHLNIPTLGLDKTGDFDIIYDKTQLAERDYYHMNPYGAYLYSAHQTHAMHHLRNNLMPQKGDKILLLGDSFSNPMAPFLALGVEAIDFVDLRSFDGSIRALIEQEGYHMVIVCYSSMFPVEYESHKNMYDFR